MSQIKLTNYLENLEGLPSSSDSVGAILLPSESKIPYGYCHCGCGGETTKLRRNYHSKGLKKGQPNRFIQGHMGGVEKVVLNFNQEQKQILLGSLLGDGCISKIKKTFKYGETHSPKQKDYLLWKNSFLKFNFREYKIHISINKRNKKMFKIYQNLFYPNGKKIVTREILEMLEPLGIACWFMDDGSYNYNGNQLKICTHSFGLEGNRIIQEYFKEKWGIDCKLQKQKKYYYIRFNVKETKQFIEIVKSFIIPPMEYKIGLDKNKIKSSYDKRLKNRMNKKDYDKKNYQEKKESKV